MAIPQTVTPEVTSCAIATRWTLDPRTAMCVVFIADNLPWEIQIISGFRTREHQLELAAAGRPAADPDISTHCSCPATGADLRILGVTVTDNVKLEFGRVVRLSGARWGGGSPQHPETGIPSDWNHIDLGPRHS